jgi:ribosome-associated protein
VFPGARTTLTDKATAILAGSIARDKLADDVMVLDVAALTTVANFLVIASGDSVRQVKAIAEAVDEALDAQGVRLLRSEGLEHGRWVLLDYGGIVVHVFHREAREFYRIERLWADAPLIDLPTPRPDTRLARSPSSRDRERLVVPSEPG